MAEVTAKPDLDRLADGAKQAPGRGLPPVHLWNPTHAGEIDIVIRPDGSWTHEGAVISRAALVRLFSTILRKDEDGYWLVTPVEKMRIKVEDAPFTAVAVEAARDAEGQAVLRFTTNVGDVTVAGPDNPIRVETDPGTGEPRPYVHVRRGLEALILRPVFYELADMAQMRDGVAGVESAGAWFPLEPEAPRP